jgi:hypothetical protein
MIDRFDYIFSFWIFAWYLLYIAKIIKYSPKFVLILGIIENCFLLLFMIIFQTHIINILGFIILNIFIKILPYYSIRNEKITKKDIIATIVIFIIYCIYLYICTGYNVINYYIIISSSALKDQNKTPALKILHKLLSKFKDS